MPKKRIKKKDNVYYPQYRKMILGFIPCWRYYYKYYSYYDEYEKVRYADKNHAEHFLNSKH
jgi:hypothetical protein